MGMTVETTMEPRIAGRRAARGFSMIEVMLAGLLLLVIILGMLPLFTRAMSSNAAGRQYSQVTSYAKSRAEQFVQLPFNSEPLTLLAGTERIYPEYFSQAEGRWKDGVAPSGDRATWIRTTTIRQLNINDLATPLAAGAPPASVHLKEVLVAVRGTRTGGFLGPGKQVTVRLLKAQ